MKTHLKNIVSMAALGMTLLATTVPTWAGLVATDEVSITSNPTTYSAYGSMVGARSSADSRQYIGCSLDTTPRAMCSAQDSAGNNIYCVSYDAQHVAGVQRMTDSSAILFDVNRGSTTCTIIRIYNKSFSLK